MYWCKHDTDSSEHLLETVSFVLEIEEGLPSGISRNVLAVIVLKCDTPVGRENKSGSSEQRLKPPCLSGVVNQHDALQGARMDVRSAEY